MVDLQRARGRIIVLSAFLMIGFLMTYPVRTLLAEWHASQALRLLDNPDTEYRDTIELDQEHVVLYTEAITELQEAQAALPLATRYPATAARLSFRIGSWIGVLKAMETEAPAGAGSWTDHYEMALHSIQRAVSLQPTNPDLHVHLGKLMAEYRENHEDMKKEFTHAVNAYPVNSAVRYTVAMEYLIAGMNTDALREARALASYDDSYMMLDSHRKRQMVERQSTEYRSMLVGSYLFKAFEIIWRVSAKDRTSIAAAVPDNEDAQEVMRLFLETKGIDQ
jgi:hypothetical protein